MNIKELEQELKKIDEDFDVSIAKQTGYCDICYGDALVITFWLNTNFHTILCCKDDFPDSDIYFKLLELFAKFIQIPLGKTNKRKD